MKSFLSASMLLSAGTGVEASYFDFLMPRAGNSFVTDTRVITSSNCTQYTVKSGDTCTSICRGSNATFAQLMSWNPTVTNLCSNLQNLTSTEICISNPLGNYLLPSNSVGGNISIATTPAPIPTPTGPGTNSDCGAYYFVQAGDDCSTIGTKFGISLSDFIFLNPEINGNCTNLWGQTYYCVEPVGYISTYPGYGATTTTVPFNPSPATPLPYNGDPWANYTSTVPIVPIANSTRIDCYKYFWVSNLTDNAAADCWSLAMVNGISSEDFILWNPSLSTLGGGTTTQTAAATATSTQANYAYPCTLSANVSYCVALASPTSSPVVSSVPPNPQASGVTPNCTLWYQPQTYDTCTGILSRFYLTIATFYSWNPSVKNDCTGMDLGTYYCVSTYPDGIPPGQPYNANPTTNAIVSSATKSPASSTTKPLASSTAKPLTSSATKSTTSTTKSSTTSTTKK